MTATHPTHPNDLAPEHEPADALTVEQAAYVDGLRDLAEFLARNPEFINPGGLFLCAYASSLDLAERAREIGGMWRKEAKPTSTYFHLTRNFGPHTVSLFTDREAVCERVVTTETVTRQIPDPDAPPVPMIEVTEKVERVEWCCPNSLFASTLPEDVTEDDFMAGTLPTPIDIPF